MIDTITHADTAFLNQLRGISASFETIGGSGALFELLSATLFLPSADPASRMDIAQQCARTPWHVMKSAFDAHLLSSSSVSDLRRLAIPAAYIGADGLPTAPCCVAGINPRVITGKTIGVGHFSPRLAPDQINAMQATFRARLNAPMALA
jgi:hypothetical protein